jgi:hypothetical protein
MDAKVVVVSEMYCVAPLSSEIAEDLLLESEMATCAALTSELL